MFKNLLRSLAYFFSILLLSTLILTLLNYFNIIPANIVLILKLIIPLTAIFIAGYKLGTNSEKKGYLAGMKIGSIIITLFLIITLLFHQFTPKSLLYYLILFLTSILSSMVGINRKKLNHS